MVGESGTSRTGVVHRYYKCAKAKKRACDKKSVRKEWIENLAVEKAFEIVNDEKIVDYLVEELFNMQTGANPRLPQSRKPAARKMTSIMLSATIWDFGFF